MPPALLMKTMLLAACLMPAACVSAPPAVAVAVVDAEPAGCDFVGEVSAGETFWERGSEAEAVRRLQLQTLATGGDTLVCCSLSDTLVLYRYEGNQYSGRAFRCGPARQG